METMALHAEIVTLLQATRDFAHDFSARPHNKLRGTDNGKTVGTYVEHKLRHFLMASGVVQPDNIGNSASGIDLLGLNTDIKFTSVRQPQSSSPFRSFKQKIEGLGHHLLLFVYEKHDTATECFLPLRAVRFIPKEHTGDFQTTQGILEIIARSGNADDIFAFLIERNIPIDEHTLADYARSLLQSPPRQGYLTISNALQWRLQYGRVVAERLPGVISLDPEDVVTPEPDQSVIIHRPGGDEIILEPNTMVELQNSAEE